MSGAKREARVPPASGSEAMVFAFVGTTMVTAVAPEPAGMLDGVKTGTQPAGNPLVVKVTVAGKVGPAVSSGETASPAGCSKPLGVSMKV